MYIHLAKKSCIGISKALIYHLGDYSCASFTTNRTRKMFLNSPLLLPFSYVKTTLDPPHLNVKSVAISHSTTFFFSVYILQTQPLRLFQLMRPFRSPLSPSPPFLPRNSWQTNSWLRSFLPISFRHHLQPSLFSFLDEQHGTDRLNIGECLWLIMTCIKPIHQCWR